MNATHRIEPPTGTIIESMLNGISLWLTDDERLRRAELARLIFGLLSECRVVPVDPPAPEGGGKNSTTAAGVGISSPKFPNATVAVNEQMSPEQVAAFDRAAASVSPEKTIGQREAERIVYLATIGNTGPRHICFRKNIFGGVATVYEGEKPHVHIEARAAEIRTIIAEAIDRVAAESRAQGRREGMEEAASIAKVKSGYLQGLSNEHERSGSGKAHILNAKAQTANSIMEAICAAAQANSDAEVTK